MTIAPTTHLEEAQKLEADALVDLFELYLKNSSTVLRFKNENSVTWGGKLYEGAAVKLSGDARSADAEETRASLRIMNPEGLFNAVAFSGALDMATLIRKRVLLQHLDGNVQIFQQRMWYISRITEVITNQSLTVELRNMSEGPTFMIPARMFIPPEFPTVSLR
jgi:lambda family phage minor tail protein L